MFSGSSADKETVSLVADLVRRHPSNETHRIMAVRTVLEISLRCRDTQPKILPHLKNRIMSKRSSAAVSSPSADLSISVDLRLGDILLGW